MREIILILIILILIFGASIYIQKYLTKSSYQLTNELDYLKNEIITNQNNNKKISKLSNETYKKWEHTSDSWSIIVLHNEIDLIETSLIKLKSRIEAGRFKEALEEIDTSIFLINHINEKEKTSWKNIF